ncbi:MAG: S16 family serine protease [Candidatus Aenigmatarchaeota archaeon]
MARKKSNLVYFNYVIFFLLGFILASAVFVSSTTLFASEKNELEPVAQEVMYASSNVVAVKGEGGEGILGSVDIEIRPGKGRVLMNTNPFLEPDTQFSAETAVAVAQETTGKSLKDRDVILSFNMPGQVLGGPSAGAAMTTAVVAAIEGKTVNNKTAITGTIEADGHIGQIGGVIEKAKAAADQNITVFLVPKGQLRFTYYEQNVEQRRIGRFIYQTINYIPRTVDLNNYTMQFGMETKEVYNITEAVGYMLV